MLDFVKCHILNLLSGIHRFVPEAGLQIRVESLSGANRSTDHFNFRVCLTCPNTGPQNQRTSVLRHGDYRVVPAPSPRFPVPRFAAIHAVAGQTIAICGGRGNSHMNSEPETGGAVHSQGPVTDECANSAPPRNPNGRDAVPGSSPGNSVPAAITNRSQSALSFMLSP